MPRLAIDRDFLDDYSKLEKKVQNGVKEAIDKFGEHTYAGLHLEKIQRSRDDRIRTIRIDAFWRGVVLAPEDGDTYYLLKVLPHDKAITYAASHRLTVNQALGVVEVRDEGAIEQIQPSLAAAAEKTDARLFGHVSDADLARLGIDAKILPVVRLLASEAHLEAMQTMLPQPQYDALYLLGCGATVEEVWQEIAQYVPQHPVDTADVLTAMERSQGRVVFLLDNTELDRILEHPFAAWRMFLHPAQRKIAYAPGYAGPAQVTGGAGTGKTVTALHRTAYLARRVSGELLTQQQPQILLTTFTRNLADALETQFGLLVEDPDVRERVEVLNVDRLSFRIVEQALGGRPDIVTDMEPYWAFAAFEAGLPFPPTFLNREWEQVILAQDLHTEQDYRRCARTGQGTPLGKAQRTAVWLVVERVTERLRTSGQWTYYQLANEAAAIASQAKEPLYRHVVVDEAQDLHPAQWRLLRAIVPQGPDDMFIVGDPHQRIYGDRVSLARLGIQVRGRSRRLTINYRTTQEILTWAVPALGREAIAGLDDDVDSLAGYRSPLHGARPEVYAARNWNHELDALTRSVKGWIGSGIEPHAIGIAARSSYLADQAGTALKAAGVSVVSLSAKTRKDAVRVGTMHRMKGLEFQAVAVIGVSEGTIPAPAAVTPVTEDAIVHAQDLQRERCLLFVACTRARDHLYLSYNNIASPFLPFSR